jgi:hypothetical protein
MSKAYIVKRGDVIYQVSSNLKAAYDCLESHKSEMDVQYLRSYMTLTRIFKQASYFNVPSSNGPKWELSSFPIVTKFIS